MKITKKIILTIIALFSIFIITDTYAWNVKWLDGITNEKSIVISWSSSDISDTVSYVSFTILGKIKYVFSWILLIYLVYSWAQMIMSMWTDEEALSNAKRSIWYSAIGLFFINMPWTIYNAVKWDKTTVNWWIWSSWSNDISTSTTNLFINTDVFVITLNNTVIKFLEIILVWLAITIIIIAWLKIITSRWREEQVTEAKNKIIWSVIWLIFVWFIEAWQKFAYKWEISAWKDIFETIANLALFLAWPIAIFFLTLAWYYYITSGWDEEKAKKWKSIVVNTVLATAILLVSYIFLYDLMNF